jgi:hypothetical protein
VALALDSFMRDLPLMSKEAFLFREVWRHYENEEKKRVTARPSKEKAELE